MKQYLSPLRYPGGKAKLGPYFARLLASQSVTVDSYCEPYAGGAGAGLYLLMHGYVDRVLINDLNPGIAAFWRAALRQSDAFIDRVETSAVTVEAWRKHRAIYMSPTAQSDLDLGFSTYFLNRTNRSGILSARPIGGLEQTGNWKIDARFNKPELIDRIRALAEHAQQIEVKQEPATRLIVRLNRRKRRVFMYVDPPYIKQGEELYMSTHDWNDHARLAQLLDLSSHPWVLTYDVDQRVRALYPNLRCMRFGISHTAQTRKVGSEFLFFGQGLRVPDLLILPDREGQWIT